MMTLILAGQSMTKDWSGVTLITGSVVNRRNSNCGPSFSFTADQCKRLNVVMLSLTDPEEEATWNTVAAELNEREFAFVHLNYQPTLDAVPFPDGFYKQFRSLYKGTVIGAGGFTAELAEA